MDLFARIERRRKREIGESMVVGRSSSLGAALGRMIDRLSLLFYHDNYILLVTNVI